MSYYFKTHAKGHEFKEFRSPDEVLDFITEQKKSRPYRQITINFQGYIHILYESTIHKYERLKFYALCRTIPFKRLPKYESQAIYS